MATRVIIVEFEQGVSDQDVVDFAAALRVLAARTPNLVRMVCGVHYEAAGEAALSANAPEATFGNFVSVWEFEDEQALERFLAQPIHREMAKQRFRDVIRRRYVVNIR